MTRHSLPGGTVTFFLSDVEGSTRLWERGVDVAAASIARHYEVIGSAVAQHEGVRPLEQGEGDSVVAAFRSGPSAAAAALQVQRALMSEKWPKDGVVKVRIALHTGEAHLRDEDNYFGPAIIRCARLRAIAHGGQTVVSNAARVALDARLPFGANLLDLGVHQLKDLGRPEHVWQLDHPDLPSEFPPLRASRADGDLPSALTAFGGDDAEAAERVLRSLTGQHASSTTDPLDRHREYDRLFADGNRELLRRLKEAALPANSIEALREITRIFVEFSVEDAPRHQLLFQRTIPDFEPSPEAYAAAIEVLDFGRARLAMAGVTTESDFDLFTAVLAGLTGQQLANDPGGDRWMKLVDQAVDMFVNRLRQ